MHEFKTSLIYRASPRTGSKTTEEPCLEKTKKREKKRSLETELCVSLEMLVFRKLLGDLRLSSLTKAFHPAAFCVSAWMAVSPKIELLGFPRYHWV